MSKGMKIKRGGFTTRDKGFTLSKAVGVLVAVGMVGTSFVLAFGWQKAQEPSQQTVTSEGNEALQASASASGGVSSALGSNVSSSSTASSSRSAAGKDQASSSSTTPIEVHPPQETSSSSSSAAIEVSPPSASSQESASSSVEKKDYSVAYQVPESEAVDDSYFDDAMFVGDSITTGISIYGVMSNATVVAATSLNPSSILSKAAIRDSNGNLHTVLETMSAYQPGKIYVLLGANGVGWIGEEDFIAYYRELIQKIKAQHPQAIIYVQSIFPVTRQKSSGESGIYSNEKIDSYNEAIMKMSQEEEVYYLNVAEALRGPDGALPEEASTDGIHITPQYYQKWFDYLKTHTAPAPESKIEKENE